MMSLTQQSSQLNQFTLPDIGEGVAEGEILQWLVAEGTVVQEDSPLLEVMTDKVTVEIPAPKTAVLAKHLVSVGDVVPVGSPICLWGGEDTTTAPQSALAEPNTTSLEAFDALASLANAIVADATTAYETVPPVETASASGIVPNTRNVLAAPATRKLARTMGIDLTTVTGSAPNGRITPADVQQAFAVPQQPVATKQSAVPTPKPSCSFTVAQTTVPTPASVPTVLLPIESVKQPAVSVVEHSNTTERPYTGIRRTIGDRLLTAKKSIPDFAFIEAIDVTQLELLREQAKPVLAAKGVKLSILPFVLKAVSQALLAFPSLNAELREAEGKIVEKHFVNLGLAVDAPTGLVVPVLHQAHQQSVAQLAQNVQTLAEQARAGQLPRTAMQGGTFTVTSIGSIGGTIGIPIINPPEVAILAVNRITKQPIVNANDEIVVGKMMNLTLTVDHRVVDGAEAARFMNHIKQQLEAPFSLVL
jgi:pyruvate/2-oxoglutarate dehydrogenase complex dihydrolipoamide acyltransferase (E2) component